MIAFIHIQDIYDDFTDNRQLARWHTETTLAELDKQIEAFDNPALDLEDELEIHTDEEDSSICLDSLDGESSIYQTVTLSFI